MLNTLYHVSPGFVGETFLARASVVELHKVSRYYGCEAVVKVHIENHLQRSRTQVEALCAAGPVLMLQLAVELKVGWIFMDAATHLLGRSHRFFNSVSTELYDLDILGVFSKYRTQFKEQLRECELDMFCIQQNGDQINDAVPVNFFRQRLTEQLRAGKGSRLGPGYANLYHTIKKGNFCDILAQKHEYLAYVKNMCDFDEQEVDGFVTAFNNVFTKAATVLRHILTDNTLSRTHFKPRDNYRSLRFLEIGRRDLPWEVEL